MNNLESGRTYTKLTGQGQDIRTMEPLLAMAGAALAEDGDARYLSPPEVRGQSMEATARELVDAINGVYLAGFGRTLDVDVQGELTIDAAGHRRYGVAASAGVYMVAAPSVRFELSSAEGVRVESHPEDEVEIAVVGLMKNPSLAKASRMLTANGNQWSGLYKVLELLQEAGYDPIARGFCTRDERARFTQTANSAEAIGDEARHAGTSVPMPERPMTLREAQAFIFRIFLRAVSDYRRGPLGERARPPSS